MVKHKPSLKHFFLVYSIKDRFLVQDISTGLFSLFDGHGGKQVADHCAERIPDELRKEIMKSPSQDLSKCIEQVFIRVSAINSITSNVLICIYRLTTSSDFWILIILEAQRVLSL
jgi:serine/threonine protein phosphatase PrpC